MKMNIIISCLVLLLGSIENGLCMEIQEEKTRESAVTRMCHALDPRECSSLTKKKLLIGTTIAATAAVAGLVYYWTPITEDSEQSYLLDTHHTEDSEQSYLLDTHHHDSVARYGSANVNIIHSLINQGFSYFTDSLTGQTYNLRLVSHHLIFPKEDDKIRQAYGSLLEDLNSTVGGYCYSASDKFYTVCNYYNWIVDNIVCVSHSLCESACDITYVAIKQFYSGKIQRGGSVYPDTNSPILETLKGMLNMKWNITNQ